MSYASVSRTITKETLITVVHRVQNAYTPWKVLHTNRRTQEQKLFALFKRPPRRDYMYIFLHTPAYMCVCVWALFGRVCACASVLSYSIIFNLISSSPGPASQFYNLRNLLANNTGRRGRWRWRRRTWDEGHTKWMFTVAICSWCILITCTVSVCLQSHRLPSPQSLLISLHFTINYCNRQQQLAKQCYGLLALLTF